MARRVLDGTVSAQSQSATSSVTSPAISNVPAIVGYSTPIGRVSNNDSKSNWIGTSKESSNGTFSQDPNPTETDVTLLTPPTPETSLGGTKFMAHQPIQEPDPTSSISFTAIRVESEAVAEAPTTPSLDIEVSSSIKPSSLVDLPDPIETKDLNPKTYPAPSSTDEKSQEDTGKNLVSPASNSARGGGAGSPATALPETVNGKAPKIASLVDRLDSAAREDSNPKTNHARLSGDERSGKDTGENLDNPIVNLATDGGAGNVAIPLSEALSEKVPEIASLPHVLDSAAIEDPNPKTDLAHLSADDGSRKDIGKNQSNRTSISISDSDAAIPLISSSEAVNPEAVKLGVTAAANAAQAAVADASSLTSGKPLVGDIKTPAHSADPSVKDGGQSKGVEILIGGQQATSIQSAQITSQIGKSGVRIALQGEQFGAVELHAKVTGDQVSASITADHHETHALLSSDLPALQQILNERQLRVNEIIVLHNSLASSTSSDGGPSAKREATTPQQANASSGHGAGGSAIPSSDPHGQSGVNGIFDSRGRLSVRA
jgi:flagellar hook-length control protein FliK